MCTNQHRLSWKFVHCIVVYHMQSHLRESLYLSVVMDNIAQTIETITATELLLGSSDGFHNTKAKSRIIIYYDRHWFSWFAASITCSYSLGVRSL